MASKIHPNIKVGFEVQFAAIQKHQTRKLLFHDPVLFLSYRWELNLRSLCVICTALPTVLLRLDCSFTCIFGNILCSMIVLQGAV